MWENIKAFFSGLTGGAVSAATGGVISPQAATEKVFDGLTQAEIYGPELAWQAVQGTSGNVNLAVGLAGDGIRKTVDASGAALWASLKKVFPWWVWLGLAVAVFAYFGGFKWLAKIWAAKQLKAA